ncbi:MAG: type II secretion system protein [Planctomycetia bacterium]|nr:type II secretion system protein [Planctomycetia bacterium]
MTPAIHRRGFTLTELLVVISIILLLMTLLGGAVSAARNSGKISATRATIEKLSLIISQQYATYGSRAIVSATTSTLRAAGIRRIVTADLPDNWDDVSLIASGTTVLPATLTAGTFPISSAQRAYASIWSGLGSGTGTVGNSFGDAECLFMIVMRSGLADCLDCGALRTTDIGDQDGDGMPEFLDAWGNPIRYVLWPTGLQLPPSSGSNFFSSDVPFLSTPSGRVMRPLIFSGGPDKTNSIAVTDSGHLRSDLNCGTQSSGTFGGLNGSLDARADNITNFDAEAKQ